MSRGNVVHPEAQGFENVALLDMGCAVEVGRGAGHAPRTVKATCGQATLLGPALEGTAGCGRKTGGRPQPRRLELSVQATLAVELAAARGDDPLPDGQARFTRWLGAQRVEPDPPHADLKIDAVEQRTGEAPPVRVHGGRRAPARSDGITRPAARARIGGGDQGEPRRIRHRTARAGDRHTTRFERLAQGLKHRRLKLSQLVQEQHTVMESYTISLMALAIVPREIRAGIYTRISRDDAEERLGVHRQEQDLRREAERRGVAELAIFEDNDLSGSGKVERPAFERLIGAIEDHEVDLVLAWDLDRLSRGWKPFVRFYEACEKARISVGWIGGEADFATGSWLLELELRASFAREELRKIRARVARKHKELAEHGKDAGGGRPFGYEADRMTINKKEAALIREASQRFLKGEPLRSVCRDWNERGIPTVTGANWSPQVMSRMLASARISGRREHRGTSNGSRRDIGEITSKAACPGIISFADSDRIRAILSDPLRRRNFRSGDYLLTRGIARCGLCGTPLVARPRGDGRRAMVCASGPSFHGCGKIRILAEPLEKQIADELLRVIDGGRLTAAMAKQTDRGITEKLAAVESKLANLSRKWAENRITDVEWDAARASLGEQRAKLQRQIDRQRQNLELDGLPHPLLAFWPTLPIHRQRAIISILIDQVVVGPAIKGQNFYNPDRISVRWKV